ncbi:hypothetical protein ACU610_15250 [Geodermatophilus sp. URMC 61]|uniref:hypothetical protein n=1 Tax=Geodermatophilus sp. URMC 61 TaxID=3423411 RepID=UPI00406CC911
MSTTTAPPAASLGLPVPPRASRGSSAGRVFLTRYSVTLLPLLATGVGLQLGWGMVTDPSWAAAAAVTAGWTLAVAAWLHQVGWQAGTVRTVTWTPAAALAGPGWLSPDGLVLWGSVSTVLAVALAMATRTPAPADAQPPAPPPTPDHVDRSRHPRSSR